jgi:hypothetical protein
VKLNSTELSKTSIKTGGRKRVPSAIKRVRKKQTRKTRKNSVSPTNPPSTPDSTDKTPKHRSFWKRFGRRSHSHSAGSGLRRSSSLKRMASVEAKAARPSSPKFVSPSFDFRTISDNSSSSSLSSGNSSPSSPTSLSIGRPGWFVFKVIYTYQYISYIFCLVFPLFNPIHLSHFIVSLHGLLPKLRTNHSPRRKSSTHVPVSPLARTPSPTTSHPPRSTSPLTVRGTSNSPQFTSITQSQRPGSPLLRRALSPELIHLVKKSETKPENHSSSSSSENSTTESPTNDSDK